MNRLIQSLEQKRSLPELKDRAFREAVKLDIQELHGRHISWNSKGLLMTFTNGVYDFETNRFRATSKQECINSSLSTGYEYHVSKEQENMIQFFMTLIPNDEKRELFLNILSMTLIETEKTTPFLVLYYNDLMTQKVLFRLFTQLLGTYCHQLQSLTYQRTKLISSYDNKRLVCHVVTTKKRIPEALVYDETTHIAFAKRGSNIMPLDKSTRKHIISIELNDVETPKFDSNALFNFLRRRTIDILSGNIIINTDDHWANIENEPFVQWFRLHYKRTDSRENYITVSELLTQFKETDQYSSENSERIANILKTFVENQSDYQSTFKTNDKTLYKVLFYWQRKN